MATAAKPKGLGAALFAVQQEAPELQKNAINPHFGHKYLSLDSLMEQILPLLHRHEIMLMQFPTAIDGAPALRTVLTYVPTGAEVEDTMPLCLQRNDPQGQGAAITYARRYALMAMLGLVADEDTDAHGVKPAPRAENTPPSPAEAATALDSSSGSPF